MILSRTSQYAIQTLIFIAMRQSDEPVLARHVAERLGVPAPYLSKIMQTLCKGDLLDSFRGPQGGFRLKPGVQKTDLMQIIRLLEGQGLLETCVLGLKVCSDKTPCPMHHKWQPIKKNVVKMLQDYTLEILAEGVKSGMFRIADLPLTLLSPSSSLVESH
jgi:Rrf2 family transcriptional regulator, iron-sulfur cluster assembly transcription factor